MAAIDPLAPNSPPKLCRTIKCPPRAMLRRQTEVHVNPWQDEDSISEQSTIVANDAPKSPRTVANHNSFQDLYVQSLEKQVQVLQHKIEIRDKVIDYLETKLDIF